MTQTHDRWFARSFDRFLVFHTDGRVSESDRPVWSEEPAGDERWTGEPDR